MASATARQHSAAAIKSSCTYAQRARFHQARMWSSGAARDDVEHQSQHRHPDGDCSDRQQDFFGAFTAFSHRQISRSSQPSRSVTSWRNCEFSNSSSAILSRSLSVRSAISLCSFPCVAKSFAGANLVAISTLGCLFSFTATHSWRTRPWAPRASRHSHGSMIDPGDARRLASTSKGFQVSRAIRTKLGGAGRGVGCGKVRRQRRMAGGNHRPRVNVSLNTGQASSGSARFPCLG
jgi:hypothetical protein